MKKIKIDIEIKNSFIIIERKITEVDIEIKNQTIICDLLINL